MKKTLIALAVVAASGTSFAQVSITGQLIMGYQSLHNVSGTTYTGGGTGPFGSSNVSKASDSSGLGVDTANIYFNATEDLGGGQKIVAKLGFDTAARGSVVGGDTVLTYTNNSFGQIELGSVKGSDVFSGVAYTDDSLTTFDGKLNQIETSSDYISYAVPIGPLFFKFKHSEPSNGLGLGSGTQGAAAATVGQATNDYILAYLKGPLQVFGAYRTYSNQDEVGGIFDGNSLTKKSVVHIEGGYDFGVAKLGLGVDHVDASWGFSQDSVMLGASVPVGAWTFSGAFESVRANAIIPIGAVANPPALSAAAFQGIMSQADGTANGMTLGAAYNFSKRTSLNVKYASWVRSGYEQFEAFGQTQNPNEFGYKERASDTRVVLTTNF